MAFVFYYVPYLHFMYVHKEWVPQLLQVHVLHLCTIDRKFFVLSRAYIAFNYAFQVWEGVLKLNVICFSQHNYNLLIWAA